MKAPSLLIILSLIHPYSFSASDFYGAFPHQTISAATTDRQRAVIVLRELLAESDRFEENFNKPINLLYLKYRIADLLWDDDPALARRLFIESFREAGGKKDGFRPVEREISLRMRREILQMLFPHDATLAEEMAISFTVQDNATPIQVRNLQSLMLTQVATDIMPTSPHRAATLIQHSFNGFFSPEQIEALALLRKHQPARANEIFQHALSMIERKPTGLSNKFGILSPYLFPELDRDRPPDSKDGDDAKPSAALIKPYLDFVYKMFMGQTVAAQIAENNEFGKASFDTRAMESLVPYFEKQKPEQAAAFRKRVAEVKSQIRETDRLDSFEAESELYRQFFSQSVPDLLEKAKKEENAAKRADMYGQAIYILVVHGKFDEALALLPLAADTEEKKVAGRDFIYDRLSAATLLKGEIDQATRHLKNVSDPGMRASGYINLAKVALKQQRKELARQYVEEARKAWIQLSDEWARLHTMIALANLDARLDAQRGFESIGVAIETLNKRGWGDGNGGGYGPEGISLRMNLYDFSEGLRLLARSDFARALTLAKSIQEKESSAYAQLAVCRGILRSE